MGANGSEFKGLWAWAGDVVVAKNPNTMIVGNACCFIFMLHPSSAKPVDGISHSDFGFHMMLLCRRQAVMPIGNNDGARSGAPLLPVKNHIAADSTQTHKIVRASATGVSSGSAGDVI